MNGIKEVIPLFITLFICTIDGYSMMNYRLPAKYAYACFAAVAVFCFAVNAYIAVHFGSPFFHEVMVFTIGLPYFLMIMLITADGVSKTVFNFWLWINIYEIISDFSMMLNDCTFDSDIFLTVFRAVLLCGYFVLYNKFLKKKHKAVMEKSAINWWIFLFIPMWFTVLICVVKYYFGVFHGLGKNYVVLMTIHVLMILVYVLMFYAFKTAHDSAQKKLLAQNMREQLALQKKQYEFYLQGRERERIFRHDVRHRNTVLMGYLENGDVEGAKNFIRRERAQTEAAGENIFCKNALVNAVLVQYCTEARKRGLRFLHKIQMPEKILCDEAEFCVMLSNLFENSVEAAKSYIKIDIRHMNCQLLLNIENDYEGTLQKADGKFFRTTKADGSGLGLKSVDTILKNNHGFFEIDDKNGVFKVFAALKN